MEMLFSLLFFFGFFYQTHFGFHTSSIQSFLGGGIISGLIHPSHATTIKQCY